MDDLPTAKRPGISDGLRRLLDQRAEGRDDGESQTAIMNIAAIATLFG
ncbi:MAG: hypothetical protein LH610_09740 [Sphingomonas bacterium]|nr:hypothetical protein [Sphingomonas bacterium]